MPLEAPQWDLEQIGLGGPDAIKALLKEMPVRASEFVDSYRGRLGRLGPDALRKFIEARDAMFMEFEGAWLYCRLSASAKTADPVAGALNNSSTEASTAVGQALAPLEIELGKRLMSKPEVVSSKQLATYRHYLEKLARAAPHLLSEAEERVILDKDKSGAIEWQQLQRSWLTTRTFTMTIEGKEVSLSFGQMYGNLRSPDRDVRRQTTQVLGKALGENEIVWSHALRAICSDHIATCKGRGYSSPEEASYVAHDVQAGSIVALMNSIEKNTGLNDDWMTRKAKLMRLPKLSSYDIFAPLPSKASRRYTWDEGKEIVTSAYSEFDGQMGEWVKEMFASRHIDADVRPGKYNGAFSDDWLKGRSAFILQSFNGALDDVNTLAHELGHSMHSYLYSRFQAPSNCRITPCVAECASTFGELLLTEKLLRDASSEDERTVVLAKVLDGFHLSVFLTATRFRLESGLY
ncbi:MAG: M3 family metallopeptidase, partial [Methanomassiliicoccales archaeon]